MTKYKEAWENVSNFYVSEIEEHPSEFAHKMYTDILYEEIIPTLKL